MFHLPDELIDYIFSFDCNMLNKQIFNKSLNELLHWYSWKRTELFMSNKYSIYDIYYNHNILSNPKNILTSSQYILWISKMYGDCVILDSMKWKLRKKL